MSFWSKRIKDTKTIAKELNVDEEKIKELTNGERQIEGKTMDKVLEVIEQEKINKPIRNMEILQWYRDTDLKALRKKFGYSTQKELADKLKCVSSVICNFERKLPITYVSARLIQLYNFYQDDFNKKINKTDENDLKIWNWYNNTDLMKLRKELGYNNQRDIAKLINKSQSVIVDFEKHNYRKINDTVREIYKLYNDSNKPFTPKEKNDDEIYVWYKSVNNLREYSQKFGYSKNKLMSELNLSYDQIRDFERHYYKSATSVVKRAYDFFHNEKNRRPAIKVSENIKNRWKDKDVKVNASEQEIYDWYLNTNFTKLRGEISQVKISRLIDIPQSRWWYIENHRITTCNPSLKKVYNYFNSESGNKEENNMQKLNDNLIIKNVEILDNEVKAKNNKTILEEVTNLLNKKEHEVLELLEQNEKLKLQISRYEKLIDRL